jgi:hypothetical protein
LKILFLLVVVVQVRKQLFFLVLLAIKVSVLLVFHFYLQIYAF